MDPALRRELARRRALARRRRKVQIRRRRLVVGSLAVLGLVVAVVGLSSHGAALAPRAGGQPVARPRLHPLVASRVVVPGRLASLPWPAQGEGAVAVRGVGLMGASGHQRVVPIASLTKMMTAYVVLHDHPLAPTERGPVLQMTRSDVAAYVAAVQAGDSNLPVQAGERLSEHQLLEALLIPSADNIADLLGRWDAGSDRAFVAKMNATARALGLDHTHYADASGVNPRSRSTAADQARLATDLMGLPIVRTIVRNPRLPFPVAGTITNYNPALGTDGVIGVKSGFTGQAQGCLATAAWRRVGGRSVLVVTVSLGQPDALYGAARADVKLLAAATQALVALPVAPASGPLAKVTVPWASSARTTAVPVATTARAVGWPGLVLHRRFRAVPVEPAKAPRRHAPIGSLALEAPWGPDGGARLVAATALPAPPAGWAPRGR